ELEGDLPIQLGVVGGVHHAHAAFAEEIDHEVTAEARAARDLHRLTWPFRRPRWVGWRSLDERASRQLRDGLPTLRATGHVTFDFAAPGRAQPAFRIFEHHRGVGAAHGGEYTTPPEVGWAREHATTA